MQIDDIPWWALFDAYGPATQIPDIIARISSSNEEICFEAINDGLYAHIVHQKTFYSATPYTIPFIAGLLRTKKQHGKSHLLGFLQDCAENSKRRLLDPPIFWILRKLKGMKKQTLLSGILESHEIFKEYLNDESEKIRKTAQWLDNFCEHHNTK